MPELPEIETIFNYLQRTINNNIIEQVIVRQFTLRWPIDNKLGFFLKNSLINRIYRRAKYLLIDCYKQKTNHYYHLIIHLGMAGKLTVVNNDVVHNKHDHVDFKLHNGKVLRYTDPRRFGSITLTNTNPLQHFLLINLGPEPFDVNFNAKYLLKKAYNKRLSIKQFIMDSKVVVGIGNIYANEALFAAKIHPLSTVKNMSLLQFKLLVKNIKKTLKEAILQGGTTLRDFFDPSGSKGKFINALKVYGKSNQSCTVCSHQIKHAKLGQRSTFFCNNCQLLV